MKQHALSKNATVGPRNVGECVPNYDWHLLPLSKPELRIYVLVQAAEKIWIYEKVKSDNSPCLINGDPKMSEQVNMATVQLNGDKQNFILDKKDFKTGSKGYFATGKMVAGGKKYQVQIQCVEIGSKPKETEK